MSNLTVKSSLGDISVPFTEKTSLSDIKAHIHKVLGVDPSCQKFKYGYPPQTYPYSDKSVLTAIGIDNHTLFHLIIEESVEKKYNLEKFTFPKDFPKYIGDLQVKKVFENGSSHPELSLDPYSGKFYVVKKGFNHNHCVNEYITNEAYRAGGCPYVPRGKLEIYKGDTHLVNEFIEGKTWKEFKESAKDDEVFQVIKELKKHFVLDCLFGNWDVLGADDDNVIVDNNLIPWRIDNAGSLSFRAKGQKKQSGQWSGFVPEINTMIDEEMNPCTGKVFGDITPEEIQEQIKEVIKKKDAILFCLQDEDKIIVAQRLIYLEDIVKNDSTSQYDDQLKMLEDMGFSDKKANLKYLIQSGGNVEFAINQNLKNL